MSDERHGHGARQSVEGSQSSFEAGYTPVGLRSYPSETYQTAGKYKDEWSLVNLFKEFMYIIFGYFKRCKCNWNDPMFSNIVNGILYKHRVNYTGIFSN